MGAASSFSVNGAGNLTVGGNLANGGYLLSLRGTGAGTGAITGVISGNGGLTARATPAVWSLTGANTYIGATALQSGTIQVNTLANAGLASSLGAATGTNATIALGSTTTTATLQYVGSTNSTTDRLINLAGTTGGATLDSSGTGTVTFANTSLTATGVGNKILTLTGSNADNNTLAGAIVNSTGSNTSVTKSGAGTWVLSSASSSYTGNTIIQSGTLSVSTLANGGVNSSIGATTGTNATVHLGSTTSTGALQYTGSGNTTNRQIDLAGTTGGGTLDASGSGAITYSNTTVTAIGVGNKTLTLTGTSTASNTLAGTIANSTGSFTSLTKTGAGTWLLTATTSTFTGKTQIQQGTLNVASLANSGVNSSLGAATGANATIAIGNGANTGTLQYTGSTNVSTNRTIDLAGTSGGATLDASGTGTLTVSSAFTASGLGNKTLTLTGTLTGTNTLSGAIVDSGGSNYTSLTKTGTGTWVLSGNSTYTGATTVGTGILNIQNAGALGNTPTTTVANGATLQMANNIITTNTGTLILNGTGTGSGALQSVSGNNTWSSDVTLASSASIFSSTVGNQLTLGNSSGTSLFTMGSNTLTIDGAGDTYFYSNVGVAGDTGGLIKNGTGKLTFFGYNTYYAGTTTINAGSLDLMVGPFTSGWYGINGALTIGAGPANPALAGTVSVNIGSSSFANQISPTSAVTINSDGVLNVGSATGLGTLTLNGGQVNISTGITLSPAGNITANANSAHETSLISGGNLALTTGTINVTRDTSLASDLTISSAIGGTNLTKTGTGILTLSGANSYTGTTEINNGTLAIQNNSALSSTPTSTLVDAGATLQLQNTLGNLTIGAETLTVNGSGYSGQGALDNQNGNNSWAGNIIVASDSTINADTGSTLTLSGAVTGTAGASATQVLTVGGAGNSTYSGALSDGSGGGSLSLTKAGTGAVALTGSNLFTGAISVGAGTLTLGAHNTLRAQTNAIDLAGGATLALTGGADSAHVLTNTAAALTGTGTVNAAAFSRLVLNIAGTNTFAGLIAGAGTVEVNAGSLSTGTLSLTNAGTSFAGLLKVDQGTLSFASTATGSTFSNLTLGSLLGTTTLLLNNTSINVGSLTITGNTILDFGSSGASILNCTNIYIAAGVTLTVQNWTSETDFLYATSNFQQIAGSAATANAVGAAPENQVLFPGTGSADGSLTTWTGSSYYGNTSGAYQNLQIRPVPEPGTYGACFIGLALGFAGLRRWRERRSARA